ncbi:aldehyde dehydrogenase family protein (plasmid) [Neorhizobium galegae]|nr:aldehyde dehydrogenase family protein [Neorhizobium galegae]
MGARRPHLRGPQPLRQLRLCAYSGRLRCRHAPGDRCRPGGLRRLGGPRLSRTRAPAPEDRRRLGSAQGRLLCRGHGRRRWLEGQGHVRGGLCGGGVPFCGRALLPVHRRRAAIRTPQVHDRHPLPARRRRRHQPLEHAGHPDLARLCRSPCRRQHDRSETLRRHALFGRPLLCRNPGGGRRTGRRLQCRHLLARQRRRRGRRDDRQLKVKAISFTGSTAVGRQIAAKCGAYLKKVCVENRRQGFDDPAGGCRPGCRRAGRQFRQLHAPGPGLHVDGEAAGAREDLRAVHGTLPGARPQAQDRPYQRSLQCHRPAGQHPPGPARKSAYRRRGGQGCQGGGSAAAPGRISSSRPCSRMSTAP